jgi:serine/threonine protein kinase
MACIVPLGRSLLCMGRIENFPLSSTLRCEPLPGLKVAPSDASKRLNSFAVTPFTISIYVYGGNRAGPLGRGWPRASLRPPTSSRLPAGPLAAGGIYNPSLMALTAGTRLDGYEVLGLIGAGGMGEVYRARDPVLRRDGAIKVLPAYVSNDPDRLRRFEKEAQAAAALNHPNILAVFQFGTFEGAPYLVSELLEGETLRDILFRGPMPGRKAVDTGVQLARGLAAAHEKGIVHRDLKPENLFVTTDGRLKILDFGLAKLTQPESAAELDHVGTTLTRGTEPGKVMGTAGYMSPEQVRGLPADHRADIFAFGAVLYEMLVGKRAFAKSTGAETMAAILNEDPPAISPTGSAIPPGLLRVVHRCLEKNPGQRFQSASDLAFALDALSESGGTPAIVAEQAVSHRKWIWASAAAVITAIAMAIVVWWRLPPVAPVVLSVTQLTDDGQPKSGDDQTGSVLVTDGSRVYFSEGEGGNSRIGQVSVTGEQRPPFRRRLSTLISSLLRRTVRRCSRSAALVLRRVSGRFRSQPGSHVGPRGSRPNTQGSCPPEALFSHGTLTSLAPNMTERMFTSCSVFQRGIAYSPHPHHPTGDKLPSPTAQILASRLIWTRSTSAAHNLT